MLFGPVRSKAACCSSKCWSSSPRHSTRTRANTVSALCSADSASMRLLAGSGVDSPRTWAAARTVGCSVSSSTRQVPSAPKVRGSTTNVSSTAASSSTRSWSRRSSRKSLPARRPRWSPGATSVPLRWSTAARQERGDRALALWSMEATAALPPRSAAHMTPSIRSGAEPAASPSSSSLTSSWAQRRCCSALRQIHTPLVPYNPRRPNNPLLRQ